MQEMHSAFYTMNGCIGNTTTVHQPSAVTSVLIQISWFFHITKTIYFLSTFFFMLKNVRKITTENKSEV